MNYDIFKDLHDMKFHGKLYIKVEVYDPEDEGLKTIKAPIEEFTFPEKKATCNTCVYHAKGSCHKFKTTRKKDDEACEYYLECDEW